MAEARKVVAARVRVCSRTLFGAKSAFSLQLSNKAIEAFSRFAVSSTETSSTEHFEIGPNSK